MNTMNERRDVLRMLGAGLATLVIHDTAWGMPPQVGAYRDFFSPNLPDLRVLGTQPARSEEVVKAQQILNSVPTTTPFAVFEALAACADVNAEGERYRGGWRERWNPLIVTMFKETGERPSGDLTPWCAASLNWALRKANLTGTRSAASGSFRDVPAHSVTASPREGDVVVFRSADPKKAKLGHGHVGLLVSQTSTHVQVLGGNQINKQGHHEFSAKPILKSGPALVLHSFHSMSAFAHA